MVTTTTITQPRGLPTVETFVLWAMVVVGGRGNVTGIIAGTLVIQTLYVGSRFLTLLVGLPAETIAGEASPAACTRAESIDAGLHWSSRRIEDSKSR